MRRLLISGLLLVLGFAVVDLLLTRLLLESALWCGPARVMELHPADVYIMGASHTLMGLDDEQMRAGGIDARNYSMAGDYPELDYCLYRILKGHCGAPQTVILSAPYFLFTDSDEFSLFSLLPAAEQRRRYWTHAPFWPPHAYVYRYILANLPELLARHLYGLHPEIDVTVGRAELVNPRFLSVTLSDSPPASPVKKPMLDYRNKYSCKRRAARRSVRFLEQMLGEMAADGVAVIMVEVPEEAGAYKTVGGRDSFYREMDELLQRHPGVQFWRQQEWKSIDPQDRSLFFDGDWGHVNSHLSLEGRRRFTAELIERMRGRIGPKGSGNARNP